MSTAIICAILVVICVFSVKSYAKKLTQGCCGSGGDTVKRIRPKDKTLSDYSHCYHISIDDMSCKNCAIRVENAFNRTEGLYAKVNLGKAEAELYSKEELSEEVIRKTIAKAGYKATKISKDN